MQLIRCITECVKKVLCVCIAVYLIKKVIMYVMNIMLLLNVITYVAKLCCCKMSPCVYVVSNTLLQMSLFM